MIYTIGVYGFSETVFFEKLQEEGIKTFWDIRSRRGLRGSLYKFANASYLEDKLNQMEITYRHVKILAPSENSRAKQRAADKHLEVSKKLRASLSVDFIDSYRDQFTEKDWAYISEIMEIDTKPIVLFCVESSPFACHRSVAAKKLSDLTGHPIKHII